MAATSCWRDWMRREIPPTTAYSATIIRRSKQPSAASTRRARSGSFCAIRWGSSGSTSCGWRSPTSGEDALVLDPLGFGDLVHGALDRALQVSKARAAVLRPPPSRSRARWTRRCVRLASDWESERSVPPSAHLATHARGIPRALRACAELSGAVACRDALL